MSPTENNSSIDRKITLSDLIDRDLVRDILQRFSDFSGLRIRITDEKGETYMAAGENLRFCGLAAQSETTKKLCDDSANDMTWVPFKDNKPIFYNCHCGLNYMIVQISSQFENLGRGILGPFRTEFSAASEKYKTEVGIGSQLIYAFEKIPLKTIEEAGKTSKFFADIMDIFVFLSVKRLLTSRLHLDAIFRARDEIISQMENELTKPEDREELERLKHIF